MTKFGNAIDKNKFFLKNNKKSKKAVDNLPVP